MLDHRRQKLLAVALSLVGVLALWFSHRTRDPQDDQPSAGPRRPDYTIEQVRALMMDEQGRPSRRLSAIQVRHFPDDDSSELDQPQLWLYDDGREQWHIRSEHGWMSEDSDRVILSGQVRARGGASADTGPLELETHEIEVFPDAQYAITDRFIEITRGSERITAIEGMKLWYAEPVRAELFGTVRARVSVAQTAADAAPDPSPKQVPNE